MRYQKILYITAAIAIAALVYALTETTVYLPVCLGFPGDSWEYETTGSPFYIEATLTTLIRYDGYWCSSPALSFSATSDKVRVEVYAVGDDQYYVVTGRCVAEGESVGTSVDWTLARYHGVQVYHTCTDAKSYYVEIKYDAYYN